jgi:hypothetical protein
MLYCKGKGCARKEECARYHRGKEFGFKPDAGLWYVEEQAECIGKGYDLFA